MNIAPIAHPSISIVPSEKLVTYVKGIDPTLNFPEGIKLLVFKNAVPKKRSTFDHKIYDYTPKEVALIKSISLLRETVSLPKASVSTNEKGKVVLNLQDLYWLYDYIREENKVNAERVYFHELFEGSEVILPKNVQVPRNKELAARCKRLEEQYQNSEYNRITKNVDNLRHKLPEDTISYQVKQINRHLVAVFQFVVSVLTGFTFGFLGIELIVGYLDFGFRLLLGIICALVIALAELYFLAKKLNDDLQFELYKQTRNGKCKVD